MKNLVLCTTVLVLLAAGPSLAQPYPGQPYPGQGQQPYPEEGYDQPSPQASAQRLHDALRLTPDQEGAWRAYQQGISPDPQQAARERQAQMLMPNLPTPRRLALMRAQMQSDLAAFDHDARAVEAFYGVLSPDQQRTFDRETARGGQGAGR
jgi:hypothetical protein